MKLTKEQRENLKWLTNHIWFKILEEIVKEMEYSLLSKFKTVNLAKEWVGQELSNSQNMLAWAEYVLNTAKEKTKEIVKKNN